MASRLFARRLASSAAVGMRSRSIGLARGIPTANAATFAAHDAAFRAAAACDGSVLAAGNATNASTPSLSSSKYAQFRVFPPGGAGGGPSPGGGSSGGNGSRLPAFLAITAAIGLFAATRSDHEDAGGAGNSGSVDGGASTDGSGRRRGSVMDPASRGSGAGGGVGSGASAGALRSPAVISWQEFKRDVLPTGLVARVELRGTWAYVYVRERKPSGRATAGTGNGGATLGGGTAAPAGGVVGTGGGGVAKFRFNVGSLETLERKLEAAQEDAGVEPRDFVPITLSSANAGTPSASGAFSMLGTVLAVGFLALMARSAGSIGGMGGGMGGMGGMGGGPFSRGGTAGGGPGGGGGGPGGIFSVGKAKATVLNKGDTKVSTTFADVAGLDEAKREIMEFVQYLRNPDRFTAIGAKIPRGALMHGPPGTGKTLLARATAGESGVPFLTMSGSDFMEMFVGVGPSRVRDLFAQARKLAPCIIFLDEIDAIGRKRGRGGMMGGNDERENTLNQLLVEMDGFAPNSGVVVLAGTNRVDVLDEALLRPGRFDRRIVIDPPDILGRRDIFRVHLGPLTIADPPGKEGVAKAMAARTAGMAGADIANVCNQAALLAARAGAPDVNLSHFEGAVDRVIGGLEKKNMVMSPTEKRTVAYHEAGHAVAGWLLEHSMPLLKVSIVPRGSAALGYAQYQNNERLLYSRPQLADFMAMALAGRAAEEMFFSSVTTGAADDFDKVTQMAYQGVTRWGLGDALGTLAFPSSGSGGSEEFYRPYSNRMARIIDEEVRSIVKAAYARTQKLLADNRASVVAVAERLLEREALGRDDMVELLGRRPFGGDAASFDEILAGSGKGRDGGDDGGADSKGTKDVAGGREGGAAEGKEGEERPAAAVATVSHERDASLG
ncbi:hypothetical protein MMPV_002963 [Pyropia vietnamensis]